MSSNDGQPGQEPKELNPFGPAGGPPQVEPAQPAAPSGPCGQPDGRPQVGGAYDQGARWAVSSGPGGPHGAPVPPQTGAFPYQPAYQGSFPPAKQNWSALAIVGFILSLTPIPLVGLGLSIAGTVGSKRKNQKGLGLGIAGIVLGVINTIIWSSILVVLPTVTRAIDMGINGSTVAAQPGECYNLVGQDINLYDPLDCSAAHEVEILGKVDMQSEHSYDVEELGTKAMTECQAIAAKQMGNDGYSDNIALNIFLPDSSEWDVRSKRVALCAVVDSSGKMKGSVIKGDSTITPRGNDI